MCDVCGGITNDEYLERLVTNIRAYGWTAQYIEGDDDRNPAFAYTLGLSLQRHPELILFNCRPEQVQRILGPVAQAVLDGRRFDEGADLSDVFPEYSSAETPRLLRMPDSSTHLYTANSMFRRPGDPPIPALQLLWPSRLTWLEDRR
ncbi:hypothetical protein GCM10009789_76150 [Kribbella sancticallisti]|uniref:DUF4262 domain-containing protein n=1 Tax=Kribbella sancticallisti TaxID=460087 RepID=A0ABP4QIM9_9ACTN